MTSSSSRPRLQSAKHVFRFVQRTRKPGGRFAAVCLKTKKPIDLDELDAGGTLAPRVCDITLFRGACVACRYAVQSSIQLTSKKIYSLGRTRPSLTILS